MPISKKLTHMVRSYISATTLESYWNPLTSENGYYTCMVWKITQEMEGSRITCNPQRNPCTYPQRAMYTILTVEFTNKHFQRCNLPKMK